MPQLQPDQIAAEGQTEAVFDLALAAADGTQTGAILRCALGRNTDAVPRFEGKASVTSDGFVMCNFIDRNGEGHMGAFVGSYDDLLRNLGKLAAHVEKHGRVEVDHKAMLDAIDAWIGCDYRAGRAVKIKASCIAPHDSPLTRYLRTAANEA